MTVSLLLAWVTVILTLLTALKYLARLGKFRALNRFLGNIHLPLGWMLAGAAMLHGIFAGNAASATLRNFQPGAVLFTWNWGTACLLLTLLLPASYLLRKKLKRRFLPWHRILTAALVLCLALHLLDVGIQLPARLLSSASQEGSSSINAAPETAASDTAASETAALESSSVQNAESGAVLTFSGAQLADGTYSGSADGYRGTIAVTVTVSGGQVTDIQVDEGNDTPQFFQQAETVLSQVIEEQSLEVDAVSGATFSSSGLLNAVFNALENAVISGTLQITTFDLSAARGHGGHGG